jgi:hypothetical protein|tara:strand:- start:380 stop:802 length:423 start_codon:yes stop_codon:yes gene_type:complete
MRRNNTTIKILTALFASIFINQGCSFDSEDAVTASDIWESFISQPGNQSDYYEPTGKILLTGTVPASAIGSVAEKRLPAYFAVFDFVENVEISGFSREVEMQLYMYYIKNPSINKEKITWGTEEAIAKQMKNDNFKPENL